MFTGIITAVGTVTALESSDGDIRLRIDSADLPLDDVAVGDSIAVNGVCLTAVELPGDGFWADVSQETISHSTIGQWQVGTKVNLEKALTLNARLGGHIVSGHVDGVGEVVKRYTDARSERLHLAAPAALAKYIAAKGSITVDGTSLTVNAVDGAEFELNIVPHTLHNTVIADYQTGTHVNLEVDVVARYLERLLQARENSGEASPQSNIDMAFLKKHGFA